MQTQSLRPAPPLSDAEVWHTAWLMAQFFGGVAAAHKAAMRHVRLVQGSTCGEETWSRVAIALKQIKARRLTRAVH